jgi:hypothetical protein
MKVVRAVVGAAVIAFCAGFIPVGGCAKGCSSAGKVASHTDDFARVGARSATRYSDDLARGAGHYGDDLARANRVGAGAVGGMAHGGEDIAAHLSRTNLEATISALPEGEGAITAIARKPTPSGARLDGLDAAGRNFGKDYAKSVDDLALSPKQHEDLMDIFETAQELADPLIELLGSDEDDGSDPDKIVKAAKARDQLQLVALELEAGVSTVLKPEQIRKFRAQFGSSEVVAYRLGKDRPIAHKKSDKVAP